MKPQCSRVMLGKPECWLAGSSAPTSALFSAWRRGQHPEHHPFRAVPSPFPPIRLLVDNCLPATLAGAACAGQTGSSAAAVDPGVMGEMRLQNVLSDSRRL